jgi:hypothetical protein
MLSSYIQLPIFRAICAIGEGQIPDPDNSELEERWADSKSLGYSNPDAQPR